MKCKPLLYGIGELYVILLSCDRTVQGNIHGLVSKNCNRRRSKIEKCKIVWNRSSHCVYVAEHHTWPRFSRDAVDLGYVCGNSAQKFIEFPHTHPYNPLQNDVRYSGTGNDEHPRLDWVVLSRGRLTSVS